MLTMYESDKPEYYCTNCSCESHCGQVCDEPIGVGATDKTIQCDCEKCKCPLCDYTEKMKYGS